MINNLLEKLGFSDKEILIYLTLIQRGRLTATEVATITKLKRTTTYSILSSLREKQVIVEDLGAATAVYLPAPTSKLIEFFEKQEHEIRKQKELATRVATEVSRMASNQPFQLAKITFVEDQDIESHLLSRTERWCSSLPNKDAVWRGFQDSRLLQLYPDYFEALYSKLLPSFITQELITEDMPAEMDFERKIEPRRKVKIWQHGYDFTYSTWVLGNYVVLLQVSSKPHYLIELKDPMMAKNMNDLFTGIWKMLA